MNKNINIALVGLGQVGIFLYNELISIIKKILYEYKIKSNTS